MKTKICSTCKKEKPIIEFHKNKSKWDGLSTDCKQCGCKRALNYYHKNKEKCNERHRIWVKNNRNKIKEGRKKWKKENFRRVWCYGSLQNHKDKFKINITIKDLYKMVKNTKNCVICGCKLDWNYGTGLNKNTPSLDRTNNENVLTLENIQIICFRCNATKQDRTMKEFTDYCKMVANKF